MSPLGILSNPEGIRYKSSSDGWGGHSPAVAYDSTHQNWMISFNVNEVMGIRIDENGSPLDLNPIKIAQSPPPSVYNKQLIFDGSNFLSTFIIYEDGKEAIRVQLVTPSNILPISEAGPDRVADIGLPIVLDASNSDDPDGNTPLDYQWKMTSQPSGSSDWILKNSDGTSYSPAYSDAYSPLSPQFTPNIAGRYVLQLKARDS